MLRLRVPMLIAGCTPPDSAIDTGADTGADADTAGTAADTRLNTNDRDNDGFDDGDDCDGSVDDNPTDAHTWYTDDDGDAWGTGRTEACDAPDALTWYADADGDGFGDAGAPDLGCVAASGYTADATDCDAPDAGIFPGQDEVCDPIDSDCDGTADWGLGVPGAYATIQDAIDAATDGDAVCVASGTHAGPVGFSGKNLTL